MLIIAKSLSASMRRPAYYPRDKWCQSVVIDTETGARVYGPAARSYCQAYMDKQNKLKGD